eukprot:g4392.t1
MTSLANFDENNPRASISSPRSLQACKQEGVLPQELIFKPMEAFQEKNLSPRLVKLRYDFFEAKRRDLLAAARRARDALLADEKREKESNDQALALVAKDLVAVVRCVGRGRVRDHPCLALGSPFKESGLSKGAVLALNSDTLKMERQKLLRAQETERNWLKNALQNQEDALREHSRKMKDFKRLVDPSPPKRIVLRVQGIPTLKSILKTLERKQLRTWRKLDALKQKEAYERQVKEAERKKEMEREKAEKREQEYRELQARKDEMKAQDWRTGNALAEDWRIFIVDVDEDQRRTDIMAQKQEQFQEYLRERKEQRDMRIYNSILANQELEQKRRDDFEKKQQEDFAREERLLQVQAKRSEETAKKQFQVQKQQQESLSSLDLLQRQHGQWQEAIKDLLTRLEGNPELCKACIPPGEGTRAEHDGDEQPSTLELDETVAPPKTTWEERQARIARMVESQAFEYSTGVLILVNIVLIGVEAEMSLQKLNTEWATEVERGFLTIYTVELILRLVAGGLSIDPLQSQEGWENLLIVRGLRLLRLARILRTLKRFKVVWRLVSGLLSVWDTMASTTCLILLWLYIFGCIAVEVIASDEELIVLQEDIIKNHFSSLPRKALEQTKQEAELAKVRKKQQIKATMPQLLQIFSGLDADGSGCLTREEVAGVPLDVLPPNVLEHVSVDNMEDLFEVWLGIGWSC